jgi:TPR repeat protein
MFSQGLGVSKDYESAMEWYLYAYNKGNVTSTTNIGYMYENGLGVEKDVKLAMKWYLEAANKGEEFAMCNIGTFYELGCGVDKDKQYALEWYKKSVDLGHQRAKEKIKRLNREGYYLNDRQKSMYWHKMHVCYFIVNKCNPYANQNIFIWKRT